MLNGLLTLKIYLTVSLLMHCLELGEKFAFHNHGYISGHSVNLESIKLENNLNDSSELLVLMVYFIFLCTPRGFFCLILRIWHQVLWCTFVFCFLFFFALYKDIGSKRKWSIQKSCGVLLYFTIVLINSNQGL